VPGGANCLAQGALSAAMGNLAKAYHDGTFVWADSSNALFESTGPQQFLIRATNGVGINTNAPGARLNVFGSLPGVNIFTGDLAPFGSAGIESNFSTAGRPERCRPVVQLLRAARVRLWSTARPMCLDC
jgi:hypothetical protein